MKKPISPALAEKLKKKEQLVNIPEQVFEAFNELIIKNLSGGTANVLQKEVACLITDKMNLKNQNEIYPNGWFDIEEHYRKIGWSVSYNKPGYCDELFDPYFEFKGLK